MAEHETSTDAGALAEAPAFSIAVRDDGAISGAAILVVAGELDTATAASFDECMATIAGAVDRVTVDVSAVGFVDSSGLRSLILARRQPPSREVVLRGAQRSLLKLLELSGLTDFFVLEPAEEGAAGPHPGEGPAGGATP